MKKILKCFRDFTPNPHQGSAIDPGEIAIKRSVIIKLISFFISIT